jgi:hypothetical protein
MDQKMNYFSMKWKYSKSDKNSKRSMKSNCDKWMIEKVKS